jgi:hypothetical protein
MAKTGESYSIARMHLMKGAAPPPTILPAGTGRIVALRPATVLPVGAARTFAANGPGVICQVKICLLDIEPTIWRRIHLPADLRLSELSLVLIEAMGWTNSHLHEFTVNGIRYGEPDPDGDDWGRPDIVDESTVSLRNIVEGGATAFTFLYDFGDYWDHTVEVEKLAVEPVPGVEYPSCVAGQRACPPEDCGGTSGYEHLLEVLADPDHDEHENLRQWLGGRRDWEAFSVTQTNVALGRLSRRRRRSRSRSRAQPLAM